MAKASGPRTLVVMPTYNERENLPITVGGVFAHCPQVHVLVVDDGSPDGTGELAERMAGEPIGHDAQGEPRLFVLHRTEKNGLGPAYLAGFRWALDRGYEVICEMDMDGSHRPQDLPRLLAAVGTGSGPAGMGGADLVIGSRRVPGGRMVDWPWYRDLISRGGSWYARTMLGVDVHDMTAGFRAYRAETLRRMDFGAIESGGYVFQIDMTRRVAAMGGTIREVPIVFEQRALGTSKMSGSIVIEAMARVTRWGIGRLIGR
ncbi:polyprenol monophosphomannose synthase [Bifidobacterium simiarum]|uniref:polyprenol monophosphomannose synthase n=1 Tax=Bifidobacterium simiarum TaxID=2045441 RepID=UPI001F0A993A|nr:polyprenol monophosphomannose synthase [Bifidobacterium simiarum]